MERQGFLAAGRLLEASLRADPGNSVAHGWLAYWNLLYVGQGWAADPAQCIAEAGRLAERAVMLDPGDARALTLAGHVRGFLGKRPAEAIALHERALALNPNLAIAWCFSGFAYSYIGDHEEALRRINQAIRLSPADPHMFFFDMATGDRASDARRLCRRDRGGAARGRAEPFVFLDLQKLSLRPRLDGPDRARPPRCAIGCWRLNRGFRSAEAVERSPFLRPEDIDRYAEGLRRAGLP